MTYYRIIFRTNENGEPQWTEIITQDMDESDFEKMNWEKPIIRHQVGDQTHFIALDSNYLDAMILGIRTYKRQDATISQLDT